MYFNLTKFNLSLLFFFFFQAEDGIRDLTVTGVQTCALPILGKNLFPGYEVFPCACWVFAVLRPSIDPARLYSRSPNIGSQLHHRTFSAAAARSLSLKTKGS